MEGVTFLRRTWAGTRESAEAKAEGIIREKAERLGWSESQLCQRPKSVLAERSPGVRFIRQEG